MATVTAGYHRYSNVSARASQGTNLQVVPGATIYVTLTSTGAEAVIYSDPALTIAIPGALITADQSGFYEYYAPLGYNVTETISNISGQLMTIINVVENGPLVGSFTTSAGSSDVVTLPGFTSAGHVCLTATNSAAASMIASVYVSAKAANSVTVSHLAVAGATFDIVATPY